MRRPPLFSLLLLIATWLIADTTPRCFTFFKGAFDRRLAAFAVDQNHFIAPQCPKGSPVVAYDPLTQLCLFEKKSPTRPFLLAKRAKKTYLLGPKKIAQTKIKHPPLFLTPGHLGATSKGGLFDGCCRLIGIAHPGGRWYGQEAIKAIMQKHTTHGEIGVRLDPKKTQAIVVARDPFTQTPLHRFDRIVAIERKKVDRARALYLMDHCPIKQTIRIEVIRGDRHLQLNAPCLVRQGGGMVSDTFLERFGMHFDHHLTIQWIDHGSTAFYAGLREGDRLIAVEQKAVKRCDQVRHILTLYAQKGSKPRYFLWQRGPFQFELPTDWL